MRHFRRRFLYLVIGAAVAPIVPRLARSQTYPTQPVRFIVGFPPGGGGDIAARLIGQRLTERLGQRFVVENRPGASTDIATEVVVRAAPDGYTLLLVTTPNAINAALYDNLNFNFVRDIAPVASILRIPLVLEVNPSFPATTILEFIAYAKANPGKITVGSVGVGTPSHVSGELFKAMTGVDIVNVPYLGGAPAVAGLLGGQVQALFGDLPSSIGQIRAGKLRALAVTSAARSGALPYVPSIGEFVPGYEATVWYGVGAPKNTPAEITDKLNQEINLALADPKIKTRIAELGGMVFVTSPAQFGKFIADETKKWGNVVRLSRAKAD